MGLSQSIILAAGFIMLGVSLQLLLSFLTEAKQRSKIKRLGFKITPDSELLEVQLKPKFFALKGIDYKKPFYRGNWQGREVELCKAINKDVGISYQTAEKLLVAINNISVQIPKTIISSRSLRLLSSIPVTKLCSLDLINYPTFKKKFSVQTANEAEFYKTISAEVLRAIEMIDDVTIELDKNQAIFIFMRDKLNSAEIIATLDDALKVIQTIELTKEWRSLQEG